MTKVFLAAGVAALAIAAPATAGPGGHGGNKGGGQAQSFARGGGGNGGARAFAAPQQRAERQQQRAAAAPQQRQQMRAERQQARPNFAQRAPMRAERQQMRAERQQARPNFAQHQQVREQRVAQAQNMRAQHQQMRDQRVAQAQNMRAQHQQMRDQRVAQVQQMRQQQMADRQQLRGNRMNESVANNGRGYGVGGCPPGLANKGCTPPGIARNEALQTLRGANPEVFQQSRLQMLTPQTRVLAPTQVVQYVGQPVSALSNYVQLAALPASLNYLYPSTPQYSYQYGGGYLYQVDRGTNLIDALLPLLAGGILPGSYLPSSYMNSYVPNYYGLNSFYPSSYDYGYGGGYGNAYNAGYGDYGSYYQNLCNRYGDGVVYQVDCNTGMVQNVIPTYAGGYGVGQMLPSAYNTYNVPMQYRDLYYPTADSSYWYAPGAIYQYDRSSSLITSVAALMAPGFTVGQQMPAAYSMYNVPMDYRSTYYDTPNAWYRYNNGNIYQVDPTTQLVTALVASLLT